MVSSIGLRMVRHNSGERFHLHATGLFSFAKIVAGFSSYPQPLMDWRVCLALNSICLDNLELTD